MSKLICSSSYFPSLFDHDYFVSSSSVKDNVFTLKVNVAGCSAEDVKVSYKIVGDVVQFDFDIKDRRYYYDVVKTGLELDKMECGVKDGVLTLTIPMDDVAEHEAVEVEVK